VSPDPSELFVGNAAALCAFERERVASVRRRNLNPARPWNVSLPRAHLRAAGVQRLKYYPALLEPQAHNVLSPLGALSLLGRVNA